MKKYVHFAIISIYIYNSIYGDLKMRKKIISKNMPHTTL